MDPQAVTAGARIGRRLRPIILLAMQKSPDPTCVAGGMLSTIVGTIAGLLGPGTAAELIRINLERLEQKGGRLMLPPGVREAFDAAANDEPAPPTGEMLEPPSEAYVLRLLGRIGELENELKESRAAFNAAIDFSLDQAGDDGLMFLRLWREGAWPEIALEFSAFKQ